MSFCEFFCHVVVGRSVNTTQSFSFVVLVLAGVFVKGHPSGRFSYAQIFRVLVSLGLARCLVVDYWLARIITDWLFNGLGGGRESFWATSVWATSVSAKVR